MNKLKVLITAGPTIERIDDVRFISNFSSGKMGFAIAETFNKHGYHVTLITGPVNISCSNHINRVDVESANDMFEAVSKNYQESDIIIMSAAVADYTPNVKYAGKIKKSSETTLNIELKPTVDILNYVGQHKSDKQILVGFALESENEIENGKEKLHRKNCDFIVVNSASKPDSGFGGDLNTITIITKQGDIINYPALSKLKCAENILVHVENVLLLNNGELI